ncbi:hypothetical protein CFC21_039319 [Triticum aestivum]|uniref:F-box domain-containing protein n=2 Tax=Triticum aestivum TaxID=4565 RepID=A0A3B6FFF7_WHEAT|nr:putative F-box protein At3g52320 [Triticum aestivum]KAF7027259.1 hypothetical protein CFC21_039319 [Triticum aestivum]
MYAMMTSNNKQKRNKAPSPELPDELVLEVMTRLPVKSLMRFKCVSKAWRTTISDPSFVRSHLKISACRWEQNPSFLIAPHTLDRDIQGTIFPGNIGFYQWQQGVSEARLVHDRDLFRLARFFSHCDGLVLVPTGTKVFLFNPATRDVLTLPESSRNKVPSFIHHPIGFGRDPRTGMYKVVRSLFGSTDCKTGIVSMGMEVCTVGGPAPPQWREIAGDQPYAPVSSVPAQSVKGGVYWIVDDTNFEPRPRGLLRFDLVDEAFNFISLPSDLSDLGDDDNDDDGDNEHFNLSVLHGELSLTGYRVKEPNDVHRLVVVWVLMEDGASSVWEPRYTLYVMDPCHPIAFLPGTLMLRFNRKLCLYDLQSRELTNACEFIRMRYRRHGSAELVPAWKHVYFCNVIPYMESLVPVGAHMA